MTFGGVETMLVHIASEQAKTQDVHIIVLNDHVDASLVARLDKRVCLHLTGRSESSRNPYYLLKFNYLLYRLKPDIVHLHYNSLLRFIFLPGINGKICATQHNVCTPINARFLHKIPHIYAISNAVKEDIFRNKNLHSELVLNGIKLELFRKKESLTATDGIFRIVQLSRLYCLQKGQHILLEAIHILIKKGVENIQLFFIGDGESEEYLRNLTHQYQLDDRVFFLGAQSQEYIFEHLCEYDLLVQPSLYEGFGLTVAEGMAAGVPVLVSENQGPLEIVDNGKYGYVFENANPQRCAEIILRIMNDPNRNKIAAKACKRVHELYNVADTAANYIKKYNEIIKQ
jgi:glycosyltransferase involved in cell wall biosynthesis